MAGPRGGQGGQHRHAQRGPDLLGGVHQAGGHPGVGVRDAGHGQRDHRREGQAEPAEQELVKHCLRFPDLVLEAGRHHGVHLLTQYAVELAGDLHNFYKFNRVVSDDIERTKARLLLMKAVQVTLRQTLGLLGISAPESM